jgi:hypothetical protein
MEEGVQLPVVPSSRCSDAGMDPMLATYAWTSVQVVVVVYRPTCATTPRW